MARNECLNYVSMLPLHSLNNSTTPFTTSTDPSFMPSPPLPYILLTTLCLLLHYPTHSLPHHAFTSITLHTPYHTMPSPPLPYTLLTTPCLHLHYLTHSLPHHAFSSIPLHINIHINTHTHTHTHLVLQV